MIRGLEDLSYERGYASLQRGADTLGHRTPVWSSHRCGSLNAPTLGSIMQS